MTVQEFDHRLGRRLRLRDIQVLAAVIEWGSMASAAKHLGTSQPAVSEIIAQLEDTFGVRLLDRGPRGARPTMYADVLLKRGQVVFDELGQGLREIAFLANPGVGEVKIGCPEFIAAGFVPTIVDRLLRQHPNVRINLIDASAGMMGFPALRERLVDIMFSRLPNSFDIEDFETEVLYHEPFFVVAGASSKWARRRKIALSELVNEQWILQPREVNMRPLIDMAFKARRLEPPREQVTTLSVNVRNQLVATGRFLTILPGSTLNSSGVRWSLKALPVDLGIKPVPTGIVRLKHRTLSPVVELFVEQAKAVTKSMFRTTG
jgi:DNA-binding transcriptional LysR family regulator